MKQLIRRRWPSGSCWVGDILRKHNPVFAAGHAAEAIWRECDTLAHIEESFNRAPPRKPNRQSMGNDAHRAGKHWRKPNRPEVERILREKWADIMAEMRRMWGES